MDTETIVATEAEGALALYIDLAPRELVDLEVAAAAVIEWSRAIKAAALVVDGTFEYRVNLIAAEPGSSKWLAAVERSRINQGAERIKRGWEKLPLVMRWTIALAVVIPGTAVPTYQYWLGDEATFSDEQLAQMEQTMRKVSDEPQVKSHRKAMYAQLQRDRKITAVGTGVAKSAGWKPDKTLPANQFAEAQGLFELQEESPEERIISPTLDVILVAPQLQATPRAWEFRQEGIPGTFKATMKDERFLQALESSSVRETLRIDIPMRIRLQIKQRLVNGEWTVTHRGRTVVEVISPAVE